MQEKLPSYRDFTLTNKAHFRRFFGACSVLPRYLLGAYSVVTEEKPSKYRFSYVKNP